MATDDVIRNVKTRVILVFYKSATYVLGGEHVSGIGGIPIFCCCMFPLQMAKKLRNKN